MSRLELIVMPRAPLTPDDVRGLLDAYAEGELDDEQALAVEDALAGDPSLAAEYEQLCATLRALHEAARPEPPVDLVAKVRARLAAEKAEALAAASGGPPASPTDAELALAHRPRPTSGWGLWPAAALTTVAACGLAAAFLFGPVGVVGDPGTQAAGVGAPASAVASLEVSGVSVHDVQALAQEHHLSRDSADGLAFTGARDDMLRFRISLAARAATAGGEVRGFFPAADVLEVRVALRPLR